MVSKTSGRSAATTLRAHGGGRRSALPSTGSSPWFSPPKSLQEPDFITSHATRQRQARPDSDTGMPAHRRLAVLPDRLRTPGGPSRKRSLARPASWRTDYSDLSSQRLDRNTVDVRAERRECALAQLELGRRS